MSKHLNMSIRVPIEIDNPSIMRDDTTCINCGMCKNVCTDYIGVHDTYSLENTNDTAVCVNCGQCAIVCPVASITAKYDYKQVEKSVLDSDKIVIFTTSPAVRVSLGEEFGMEAGSFEQGKMVGLIRALGADYVLDTNFAADLTIMEEASELISRITNKDKPLPQFTSCCPAWVKYAETYHPELRPNLSTAKSPIGMQGPTIKTYFAEKMNIDPTKIINVAVTPCTAKKFEILRPEMNAAGEHTNNPDMRDMDYVITTRELAKWAKESQISFDNLDNSEYDNFMGESSGAGTIFANSGGVMEAALRTAYEFITGEKPPELLYELSPVRGLTEVKDATVIIGDLKINVAVIYGTKSATKVIEQLKTGDKKYHFIEVMACPGGCIGGGGQPKGENDVRAKRIDSLYSRDKNMAVRQSNDNTQINALYAEFYGKPLSELAEKFLHTTYRNRSGDLGGAKMGTIPTDGLKYRCTVCGYIHNGELPEGYTCLICQQPVSVFEKI